MSLIKKVFAKEKPPADLYTSTPTAEYANPFERIANIDGNWKCQNCDVWHPLKYNTSRHPFGKLKCAYCKMHWQSTWTITKAARPFPSTSDDPIAVPKLEGVFEKQVPYFTVCTKCGLTWRAQLLSWYEVWKKGSSWRVTDAIKKDRSCVGFGHVECECGAVHKSKDWKRFSIRLDPSFHLEGGGYLSIPEKEE